MCLHKIKEQFALCLLGSAHSPDLEQEVNIGLNVSLYRKVINMCLRKFPARSWPQSREWANSANWGWGHGVVSPFLYPLIQYSPILFNADLILGVAKLSKTTDFEECHGRGHKLKISNASYFFCISASVISLCISIKLFHIWHQETLVLRGS